MRVDPSNENKIPLKVRIEKVTRVVAIIVVFLSTFVFFFKILFF